MSSCVSSRARLLAAALAALGLLSVLGACAGGPEYEPLPMMPAAPGVERPPYRFRAGDELTVQVGNGQRIKARLAVNPDGVITPPEAQPVRAEGRTHAELSAALREAYVREFQDPVISLNMEKTQKDAVYIWGSHSQYPGRKELDVSRPLRVTQLVAMATPGEDLDHLPSVVVLRGPSDAPKAYEVDVQAVMRGEQPDPVLQADDCVYLRISMYEKVERAISLWSRFWNGTDSSKRVLELE